MSDSLALLQQRFSDYLLNNEKDILLNIAGDDVLKNQRIAAYGSMYYERLADVIRIDYPMLARMLGDDVFSDLAYEYIDTYPAQHYSLRYFSKHFPDFLMNHLMMKDTFYLSELAHFEWLLSSTTDAKNSEDLLTVDDLKKVATDAWPTLTFRFVDSLKRHDFHHDIAALWQALQNEVAKPTLQLLETPMLYLFWRKNLDSHYLNLDPIASQLCRSLYAGNNFSDICEELCSYLPEAEVPQYAASQIVGWINEGLFRR